MHAHRPHGWRVPAAADDSLTRTGFGIRSPAHRFHTAHRPVSGDFCRTVWRWVYLILFLIVFVETGLVVMPFLPGDSLLFIVGAMAGAGLLNPQIAVAVPVSYTHLRAHET